MDKARAYFFSGVKNPAEISEVVVYLAAGRTLQHERISLAMLPAIVLLAAVGIHEFNQQIVDDYSGLLIRLRDSVRDPTIWHDRMWHPNLSLAATIADKGSRGAYFLDRVPDIRYVADVYENLVGADIDELIPSTVNEVNE